MLTNELYARTFVPAPVTKEDAASSTIDDYFLIRQMLFKLEKAQSQGMDSQRIDTVAALLVPEMARRVNKNIEEKKS